MEMYVIEMRVYPVEMKDGKMVQSEEDVSYIHSAPMLKKDMQTIHDIVWLALSGAGDECEKALDRTAYQRKIAEKSPDDPSPLSALFG